ncbi:hypothetical protein [Ectopseudomonas toyotomiensis]|uniref:hypothetical protein n=1 Tax=Ectopseudomonas toyotomiensis TaxID=554344 RepID=UPI003D0D4ECD
MTTRNNQSKPHAILEKLIQDTDLKEFYRKLISKRKASGGFLPALERQSGKPSLPLPQPRLINAG